MVAATSARATTGCMSTRGRWPMLFLAMGALALLIPACSVFGQQLRVTTVNECIQNTCAKESGASRQQCMGECQSRYGK